MEHPQPAANAPATLMPDSALGSAIQEHPHWELNAYATKKAATQVAKNMRKPLSGDANPYYEVEGPFGIAEAVARQLELNAKKEATVWQRRLTS